MENKQVTAITPGQYTHASLFEYNVAGRNLVRQYIQYCQSVRVATRVSKQAVHPQTFTMCKINAWFLLNGQNTEVIPFVHPKKFQSIQLWLRSHDVRRLETNQALFRRYMGVSNCSVVRFHTKLFLSPWAKLICITSLVNCEFNSAPWYQELRLKDESHHSSSIVPAPNKKKQKNTEHLDEQDTRSNTIVYLCQIESKIGGRSRDKRCLSPCNMRGWCDIKFDLTSYKWSFLHTTYKDSSRAVTPLAHVLSVWSATLVSINENVQF